MTRLTERVAESFLLPATKIKQWRREGAISIRKLPGGWRINIYHEPAISAITSAWERRRKSAGGKEL